TACVCFFGGDPACNARHSLEVARRLNEDRLVRVCYETNGNISSKWLNRIADVVESTGGTIKFDLKAYSPEVYTALTGVRNDVVLRNFRRLAQRGRERDGEFLVASILLVPGYVDLHEISLLCEFIASCDTTIPTALLGFTPHHHMRDLPRTSRRHAERAHEVAMEVGLANVRIGNVGLLSDAEYNIE
ncbi:MAG: radical SAM protein, partial [Candidatus Thorarchaeota archaeon]